MSIRVCTEEFQNMPPQNMLLFYTDYFEMKALEKYQK